MAGSVKSLVSKKNLEFTPDSHLASLDDIHIKDENEFDVIVINESDKFASFQVELSTPGLDDNHQIKWYKVEPEICAKKPPGSETKFHIEITKAPIPAYDTIIDINLKVLSVEYESLYTSQKLKLNIKKPLRPLRVELPLKEFKATPEELIEIPVIVYNLSSKLSEITLTCLNLNSEWLQIDPEWMNQRTNRTLTVEPGDAQKIRFLCQAPKNTLSKTYLFTIDAKSNTSQYTAREQGTIKILPEGIVKFSCDDKEKQIPAKGRKKSHFATYELLFNNLSNLPQQVNIAVPEAEQKKIEFHTIPENINLSLGETQNIQLVVKKKRPLIGLTQKLLFEVSADLTYANSQEHNTEIYPEPNTQVLALNVLPIIPFLLQILSGTLLLLALLLYWLLPRTYHTGNVNSVRLFGNGSLVFSGSSDETIRRWQVDDSPWQLDFLRLQHKLPLIAEKNQTKKAVRVIRQSPKDNDRLAVGLENGEVKLWDISTNTEIKNLATDKANRVFDIVFTQNGRYIFSGHGSGLVNMWDLEKIKSSQKPTPQASVNNKFTIYSLAINETIPAYPLLFIAGQFNKIAVWDWNNKNSYELKYNWLDREEKQEKPVFGQQHYITSLATSRNILASSDNAGYLTLWDADQIRKCLIVNLPTLPSNQKNNNSTQPKNQNQKPQNPAKKIVPKLCNNAIIAQRRDGHEQQPIRSVALTQDGRYLATGGDDGKIMLWSLSPDQQPDKWLETSQVVAQSDTKINSVDVKAFKNYLLVTSGDDNYNVKLYRVNEIKENERNN